MEGKWSDICFLSEPEFWILTNGGYRHPVLVLPYPNSVQVLGMEQPIVHVDELVGGGSVINGLLHLLSYAGEHGVRVLHSRSYHR